MASLHQELLNLARELVDKNQDVLTEADLRRGVSTAYYALFHLLVHEATSRLVAVVELRPRVSRSFDHSVMKKVCQDYADLKTNAGEQLVLAGQLIPPEIQNIALAFKMLQQARYQADYDTKSQITKSQADIEVMRAEVAFLDWKTVKSDPAADTFLAELLCRGIPRR